MSIIYGNMVGGASGADGKSAYAYAVEGGYTGTETEFAAKLAEEMPEALPNPNALTFTGAVTGSYDGSAALSVEIPSGGGSGGSKQPYKTQEIGQLYSPPNNYTAWCPDCLHYDAAIDKFIMLVYGKISHTGEYRRAYQTTIDPYNYDADALTLIKFYDTDGVTDISPGNYGVLSWSILSSGEYFMIASANDGVTYSFTSADYGKLGLSERQ